MINRIYINYLNFNIAGEDDLSSTDDKVGNAGKRIDCGVISEKVDIDHNFGCCHPCWHCHPDMFHLPLQKVFTLINDFKYIKWENFDELDEQCQSIF